MFHGDLTNTINFILLNILMFWFFQKMFIFFCYNKHITNDPEQNEGSQLSVFYFVREYFIALIQCYDVDMSYFPVANCI